MKNTLRVRRSRSFSACVVLWACCTAGVAAQDIGQEPQQAPRTLQQQRRPGREIQARPPQPAPPIDESYVPSRERLDEIEIDAALLSCIERLGDPTYRLREQATVELMTAEFAREQVYAAMARLELTAEQRHRLLTAVTEKLLSTPRGAVGISVVVVDPRIQPDEIIVRAVLPNLPAADVLVAGDRITHLNGELLPNWVSFVNHVQTSKPGTRIALTIERVVSGRRPSRRNIAAQEPVFKTIEVEIELGSAELLLDASGRVQRSGEVYLRLKAEADDATRTFGPRPRHLQLGR